MIQEVNNDNRVMLPPAMTAGRHDAACECGAVSMTCSFFYLCGCRGCAVSNANAAPSFL